MRALKDNISRFEQANGTIAESEMPNAFPLNFGGTKGMA
jgi:hypothetical protein